MCDPLRSVVGEVAAYYEQAGMELPDAVELYGEQEEIVAVTGEEDASFSSGEAELLVVCASSS